MSRPPRTLMLIRQLIEASLVLGLALFALHAHGRDAEVLVIGAAALTGLVVMSDGPLGVLSLVGDRLHTAALVVLILAFAAAPLLSGHPGHLLTTVVLVTTAMVLVRVVLFTWPETGRSTKHPPGYSHPTKADSGRAEAIGRSAGHLTRAAIESAETALHTNAYRAGRLVAMWRSRGRSDNTN